MRSAVTFLALFGMVFLFSAETQGQGVRKSSFRSSYNNYRTTKTTPGATQRADNGAVKGTSGTTRGTGSGAIKSISGKANSRGTNYAILIGINSYEQPKGGDDFQSLKNLDFCVADMKGLKNALLKCKYLASEKNVRLLTSDATADNLPTRGNILATLEEVCQKLRPGDAVFVAFAGHGVSLVRGDKNADQLCCSDARIYSAAKHEGLLSRTKLENMLEASQASSKIVMLDACRNVLEKGITRSLGTFSGESTDQFSIRGLGDGKQVDFNFDGFFRLNSCSPGQVSYEGIDDVQNGVFTHFLIKGLGGEANRKNAAGQIDDKITLAELFDYASARTKAYVGTQFSSQQVPRLLSDSTDSPSSIVIGYCDPPPKTEKVQESRTPPAVQRPTQPTQNPGTRSTRQPTGGRSSGGGNLGRSGMRS